MAELYKEVIMDATFDDNQNFDQERKRIISEISDQNNMLTKMRAMLLSEDIDLQDYKIMGSNCHKNIVAREADLKELKENTSETSDTEQIIEEALRKLLILSELYEEFDISEKRHLIGSIYDEKWTIENNKDRTGKINIAASLSIRLAKREDIKKPELELKLELTLA